MFDYDVEMGFGAPSAGGEDEDVTAFEIAGGAFDEVATSAAGRDCPDPHGCLLVERGPYEKIRIDSPTFGGGPAGGHQDGGGSDGGGSSGGSDGGEDAEAEEHCGDQAAANTSFGPEGDSSALQYKTGTNGADVDDLSPSILATFDDIVRVWSEANAPTPVITSGTDGHANKPNSLHNFGRAIDLRANNISDAVALELVENLQSVLGANYFVQFENFPSNPLRNHIHVEYDPDNDGNLGNDSTCPE